MVSDFYFISFFHEIPLSNRIAPDGTLRCAASHLGLYICLCTIKRMSGLNELTIAHVNLIIMLSLGVIGNILFYR